MKILITGTSGFIGYHLADSLLNQGHTVIGIDNENNYYDVKLKEYRRKKLLEHPEFKFYNYDLENPVNMYYVMNITKPDVVVHLAAQAGVRYSLENPYTYINSNVLGTTTILEAMRMNGLTKLVYASSSSVYGDSKDTDHPISLYAATKKATELIVHSYSKTANIDSIGLRFFTVYGSAGRPDMAYFKFTKAILKGEPIEVFNNGDLMRDFTHVSDILMGIKGAIFFIQNETGYYYCDLGGGNPIKLMDFITTLEDVIGKKAVKKLVSSQLGDVKETRSDNLWAAMNLNYYPTVELKEGLQEFYTWYKEYYGVKE